MLQEVDEVGLLSILHCKEAHRYRLHTLECDRVEKILDVCGDCDKSIYVQKKRFTTTTIQNPDWRIDVPI